MPTAVRLGSDVLLCSNRLTAARVGVVCNHASIDRGFLHVIDRVATCAGVTLGAIFGPQHGFRSDVQDNMVETPHGDDPRRRVPIYSLYSETREPSAEMLRGLDALVIDLQDIGARIYTYIYTMANCMRAAARYRVQVIVCDRPNPIGGEAVGGMEGWTRDMYADETGLPWVMPSPNMPTLDTAIVYPGTVLFEGTMLSEGRGTTRPFELVGAPWIEAERFAAQMNGLGLPGVYFRPAGFEPTFQKHAREACGGCQIHVTDRGAFEPVIVGVALIDMFRRLDPIRFGWRQPPYEYEHDKMPIDILGGSDVLRQQIERGMPIREIA